MVIYKLTSPSGHVYIGKTTNFRQRLRQHEAQSRRSAPRLPLYRAIAKYGWSSFQAAVIDTASSSEELSRKEVYWIAFYNSFDVGYNATRGGDGGPTRLGHKNSPEARLKIAEALTGRKLSQETREKMSRAKAGEPSPLRGRTLTEEHKRKLREARGNHAPMRGKKHSEDSKAKMRKSQQEQHEKEREDGVVRNHQQTPETKLQISEGMKKAWRAKQSG